MPVVQLRSLWNRVLAAELATTVVQSHKSHLMENPLFFTFFPDTDLLQCQGQMAH